MYHSFRPGKFWYDTEGELIQAHGGSVIYAEGKYYWYGENKTGVTGRATGEVCPIWHQGVQVYSSEDLYNWKNEGTVSVDFEDEEHPFYVGRVMDRPHILYNETTKKYVMWAKIGGLVLKDVAFENCYFAVCESESMTGTFELVAKVTELPAGDFDLIKCEEKAYIIFEKPHTEMICAELTADYRGITAQISTHIPKPYPPFTREAPAYFERNGEKYIITSGTTGYYPNQSILYQIPTFHGKWVEVGDACEGDVNQNSFQAQFSSVFKHPFEKDLYIAIGDRWLNDISVKMPKADDVFESVYNPNKENKITYNLQKGSDENTSLATYVWLPICFTEEGRPYIVWHDEWNI